MFLSLFQSVQELRQLMEEVRTMKAEREVLETQLKDPITDISMLCVCVQSVLSADMCSINHNMLSDLSTVRSDMQCMFSDLTI